MIIVPSLFPSSPCPLLFKTIISPTLLFHLSMSQPDSSQKKVKKLTIKPIEVLLVIQISHPYPISLTISRQSLKPKKESKHAQTSDEGIVNNKYFGFDITEIRSTKQKAFVGYLSLNVIDPPDGTVWGRFNNRAVNQPWVNKLCEAYVKNWVDNCTDVQSMDVVIDLDHLVNDRPDPKADPKAVPPPDAILTSVEGLTIHAVPEMKFTPEGREAIKAEGGLWMLSGNHRRLALTKYVNDLKIEIEKITAKVVKIVGKLTDEEIGDLEPNVLESVRVAQDTIKEKEETLRRSGLWAIKIHDKGEPQSRRLNRSPTIV